MNKTKKAHGIKPVPFEQVCHLDLKIMKLVSNLSIKILIQPMRNLISHTYYETCKYRESLNNADFGAEKTPCYSNPC